MRRLLRLDIQNWYPISDARLKAAFDLRLCMSLTYRPTYSVDVQHNGQVYHLCTCKERRVGYGVWCYDAPFTAGYSDSMKMRGSQVKIQLPTTDRKQRNIR